MGRMVEVPGPASVTLKTMVADLARMDCRVGWFEGNVYDESGIPVAYVAAIQEFGVPSRKIPPRPYFRPTQDEKKVEWIALMGQLSELVARGEMTVHDAYDVMGLTAVGDVNATIRTMTDPPLSPITILARAARRKGETITGKSIGAIAAQVRKARANGTLDTLIGGLDDKLLNDSGKLIATLTHVVGAKT